MKGRREHIGISDCKEPQEEQDNGIASGSDHRWTVRSCAVKLWTYAVK